MGRTAVGLLYLGTDRFRGGFDAQVLDLLTIFAAQASLLLQNALLLDELRAGRSRSCASPSSNRRYGELVGAGAEHAGGLPAHREGRAHRRHRPLEGETGTGKELVAREIHRRCPRADGAFVAVNCGAIPETLLESELFGHVEGGLHRCGGHRAGPLPGCLAAERSSSTRLGRCRLGLQVKLLRALQERVVQRVGDSRPEPVDIRVVAATNRNLEDEVREGRFREDLYYRLHVVTIALPPLRERGDDVTVLARWFLQRYAGRVRLPGPRVRPGGLAVLRKYHWPGNIRELENRVKKAAVLADERW